MKIKPNENNKFYRLYFIGFFIILALPLLAYPPYFFPPDWGKAIVFRIVLAIMLFALVYQAFYKKGGQLPIKKINWKSSSYLPVWLLALLLFVYLLATIFSTEPSFSFWDSPLRSGGVLNFAFFVLFSLLIWLLADEKNWKKVWDFSIFIGLLVALIGIFQYFGFFKNILVSFEEGGVPSTTSSSSFFATYLLFLTFMSISFGLAEKSKKKFFYFGCLPFFMLGIIASGARAAYLGLVIGFLYYLFFYPKKIKLLKVGSAIILMLAVIFVSYVNFSPNLPNIFQKNNVLNYISSRLSLKTAMEDLFQTRASVWKIGFQAIKEKPVLGWGPENFSVAFDKNYNPSLPNMAILWWDRAHNFLVEYGVNAGIIFLAAYILLVVIIFWRLQKIKIREQNQNGIPVIVLGIQSSLIGYLINNFFTFDGFSTYLLFFLVISYSFFLIFKSDISAENNTEPVKKSLPGGFKKTVITILFIILIWFIWIFNINFLRANAQIIVADYFIKNKKCDAGLAKIESLFSQKNALDSYIRIKYIDFIKDCAPEGAGKDLEYAKKGIEAAKVIVKNRPTYTRGWIALGAFTNILINAEKDSAVKEDLINQANYYFKNAQKLSPKRPEIIIEWSKTYFASDDYQKVKEKSEECLALTNKIFNCYWYLGLAQIALNDTKNGEENLKIAKSLNMPAKLSYSQQLVKIYTITKNYKKLVDAYMGLLDWDQTNLQYHASLAYVYSQLKDYRAARNEAMIVLKLGANDPEIKKEVELFLGALPQ